MEKCTQGHEYCSDWRMNPTPGWYLQFCLGLILAKWPRLPRCALFLHVLCLLWDGFFWFQEPYFRFNDVSYRWIAYDNWTYATIFSVSAQLRWNQKPSRFLHYSEFELNSLFFSKRAKEKILLVFDGVDTVSSVWLNGVQVGSTDNMFRRYVSPVGTSLPSGRLSAAILRLFCVLPAGFPSWRRADGGRKRAESCLRVAGSLCSSEVSSSFGLQSSSRVSSRGPEGGMSRQLH